MYKELSFYKGSSGQHKITMEAAKWVASDSHSFPSEDITVAGDIPFEKEDKDEVEKESFTDEFFYSIQEPVTNNLFSEKIVSSYNRYFFKLHFLEIFSPPPNTNRA